MQISSMYSKYWHRFKSNGIAIPLNKLGFLKKMGKSNFLNDCGQDKSITRYCCKYCPWQIFAIIAAGIAKSVRVWGSDFKFKEQENSNFWSLSTHVIQLMLYKVRACKYRSYLALQYTVNSEYVPRKSIQQITISTN